MIRRFLVVAALSALAVGCGPAPSGDQSKTATQQNPAGTAPASNPAPAAKPHPRAGTSHHHDTTARTQRQPSCSDCGTVAAIEPLKVQGKPSLLGTLAGAAAGGLIGSQFGKGTGKAAMTGVGVLGGALAGRAAESEINSSMVYRITIALDAGGSRVITLPQTGGLALGEKVRVSGNTIYPR